MWQVSKILESASVDVQVLGCRFAQVQALLRVPVQAQGNIEDWLLALEASQCQPDLSKTIMALFSHTGVDVLDGSFVKT